METAQQLGRRGEQLAARHLQDSGYTILDRNWTCAAGELDIVALHDRTVVAVEVKTRRSVKHGRPMEAITAQKARRLRRLLYLWRAEKEARPDKLRVDAVLILDDHGNVELEHRQGIA